MTRTTGTPQTKASELLNRLHSIAKGGAVDEVELRRIERDADKLLGADVFMGHQILGALAALRQDETTARNHHRIALELAQNAPDMKSLALYNLAVSLNVLGQHADAATQAWAAVKIGTPTEDDLAETAEVAIWVGRITDAAELMGKMVKVHRQAPAVRALQSAIQRGVFTEKGLQAALGVAHELIRHKHTRILSTTIHAEETEADEFVMEIHLRGSNDVAKYIEREFDQRVIEDPDLDADPGTAFVPMLRGERPSAS